MEDWLQPLLRGLHYALLLGLFGVTAFRSIGLRGLPREHPDSGARVPLVAAAVAALVVSILLMLAMIAAMMGQAIGELERASVEAMLFGTSIGWAFGVRIACLIGAILAMMFAGRFAGAMSVACYAVALATLPWSGHAAAAEGDAGILHRASDAIHLLAAGLWIGAIGWFLKLTAAARRRPSPERIESLLTAMHRFAPLGLALVGIVSISGLINAGMIIGFDAAASALGSAYGQLLALKVVLVGVMLAFAARNAGGVRRRTNGLRSELTLDAVQLNLRLEILTAAGVIGTVAILGLMSPGMA